jgi:hypothetical protein
MDSAKQQLIDKLKTANNILVTVSRNPSVDQLSSCIGLTLLLNKQGKHAAAVFSGEVPSTLEFLQPEETLEKNTDSLRDFIIALDKSKADKLRYKVEDNVVRIFITPYKTSISQDDLEFSEGDFNVDVVVALGVLQQEDLDEAITAHGRILHDATVASINTAQDGGLGTINWRDPQASSLSELITEVAQTLGDDLLDTQIATALLTGIVSETDRFSNDKTSSQTMSASAALMAAGANQQLVASKLEESVTVSPNHPDASNGGVDLSDDGSAQNDGVLEINHDDVTPGQDSTADTAGEEQAFQPPGLDVQDLPPTSPETSQPTDESATPPPSLSPGPKLMTEPPTMGGTLTANTTEETLDPANDPFGLPTTEPPKLLSRKDYALSDPMAPEPPPPEPIPVPTPTPPEPPTPPPTAPAVPSFTPPPSTWTPSAADPPPIPAASQPSDSDDRTLIRLESSVASPHIVNQPLTELEKSVGSSHAAEPNGLDVVRDEVNRALNDSALASSEPNGPIEALNAQPLGDDLHPATPDPAAVPEPDVTDPTAPPPVPPPIPFQFGNPPPTQ